MADEDDLQLGSDDEEETESPEELMAKIDDRAMRVEAMVSEGRIAEAIKAAVTDPPFRTRSQACKDANWDVVRKAILSVADVDDAIAGLKSEGCDTLMRYVYRGLSTGEPALCAASLRVHEKLTEKAGLGCIMRVLADKKHTV
eukprot:TRINITY_DN9866_c0_g1_i1.p1 TRINITY_DN9866_c0_g1~~TRINITY_DN9866_c0_g1_i1.p1  ORF type:complete len:167 (+),score=10.78 TRINITY_DN9866_c0_g1_i1:75-503(+)